MFVGVMVMEAGTAEEEICCSVWLPRRNRVPFPFWMGNTSSTKQQQLSVELISSRMVPLIAENTQSLKQIEIRTSPFTRLPAGRTQSVVKVCFLISLLFWKPFPDRSFTTVQQIMTSSSIYYSASAYYHGEHQCPSDQRSGDICRKICRVYSKERQFVQGATSSEPRVPSSCHAKVVVSTSCLPNLFPEHYYSRVQTVYPENNIQAAGQG